jgi:hypothetical protein
MADADARVNSIRSELKVARVAADRHAVHTRMEERWAGLTLRSAKIALSVYVHNGFDGECARRFCVLARQRRKIELICPNADFPVEEWFHGRPLDDIAAIAHPRTDAEESIQSEARRFMASWQRTARQRGSIIVTSNTRWLRVCEQSWRTSICN